MEAPVSPGGEHRTEVPQRQEIPQQVITIYEDVALWSRPPPIQEPQVQDPHQEPHIEYDQPQQSPTEGPPEENFPKNQMQTEEGADSTSGAETKRSEDSHFDRRVEQSSLPKSMSPRDRNESYSREDHSSGQADSRRESRETRIHTLEEITVQRTRAPRSERRYSRDPSPPIRGSNRVEYTEGIKIRRSPVPNSERKYFRDPSPPTGPPEVVEDPETWPLSPTTALTRSGGMPRNNPGPLSFILDFSGVKGLPLEAPFIWRHPVRKLLKGKKGPAKIMRKAKMSERRSITEPVLRWIHLPANNMSWVESLVHIVCKEKLLSDEKAKQLKESILRHDFWTANQHGRGSKHFHTRFMKPTCFVNYVDHDLLFLDGDVPKSTPQGTCVLLYMPYIHWELQAHQRERCDMITAISKGGQHTGVTTPEHSAEHDLIRSHIDTAQPLHIRRTLDQYFYTSLKSTTARDDDQVVYRYAKNELEGMEDQELPIMMVDQLWLLMLYDDTIITAFPTTFGSAGSPDGHSSILESILGHVSVANPQPPVVSSWDLATLIMDHASGFFFKAKRLKKGLEFIESFENSIALVNDKQASKYSEFSDSVAEMEKLRSDDSRKLNDSLHQTLDKDSGIATEMQLVKEIKDILDELNSISKVFREQIQVTQLFSKGYERILDQTRRQRRHALDAGERARLDLRMRHRHQEAETETEKSRDDAQRLVDEAAAKEDSSTVAYRQMAQWQYREPIIAMIENRLSEFAGMEYQAQRTYDALRDLLDLRQKQASLSEAWSARKQVEETAKATEESAKLAAESVKQGRTIMLFTVVTIIFLPLSFFCSIFGMNTKEINNSPVGLVLILPLMFIGSTLIIGGALLLAFNSSFRTSLIRAGESLGRYFILCIRPKMRGSHTSGFVSRKDEIVLFRHSTDPSRSRLRTSEVEKPTMGRSRINSATTEGSYIGQTWWQSLLSCFHNWTIWDGFSRARPRPVSSQYTDSSEAPQENPEKGRSASKERNEEDGTAAAERRTVIISPMRQVRAPEGIVSESPDAVNVEMSRLRLPRRRSFEKSRTLRPDWLVEP